MPSTVRTRVVLQIRVPFRARFIRVPYYIGDLTLISRTTHNGFGFRCSHGQELLCKCHSQHPGPDASRSHSLSQVLDFRLFHSRV